MDVVAAIVSAVFGLVFTQLLHPTIHRAPMRMRRNRPALHCQNCGVSISSDQRWPLVARLRKRNACRNCATTIWPDSPMYELTTMALLAVTGGFIGFGWALPAYLLFFSSLWLVTLIDFRHYLIPNRILYPTLFGCIGMLTLAALLGDDFDRLLTALLGMAVGWLFFFIVWFVYPPGLGFGDVRLSALIGLLAGWLSLLHVGLAVILGLLFGAVCGLVLMAVRIRGRKEAIPFGPFLAAGAVVSIVAGAPIINWWLGA